MVVKIWVLPSFTDTMSSINFQTMIIHNFPKRSSYLKSIAVHLGTVWYLNNYDDTQSIVAEFKKLEGARYRKKIASDAPDQKLTEPELKSLRIASIRGHIVNVAKLDHKMALMWVLNWLELTCKI